MVSTENLRKLASVIVSTANNSDAIALSKALAACLYDFPLFVEAVSRAPSNSDNETIYKLVRMGLDLDAWKKIAAKAGDKNVYEMMIDTRRSNANGVNSPGGVVFTNLITDRAGDASAAGATTISLHDVMSGMVTVDDTPAVAVPGSGRLVGASSNSSAVTFSDNTDLAGANVTIRPATSKFTGHFTHVRSVNGSNATSGEGKTYVTNCLFPCTVRGFKQLTSAAENLKFDYYAAGQTESEYNQVFGYHRTTPQMPATRSLTAHSSLRFLVRSDDTTTAANAGVVGNGWFVSVFENSSNAALTTNYSAKTDGTHKTEAENSSVYDTTGEFYSGYPTASDILGGLSKNGWNASRLVALGLEYRDIQNAGFPIDLKEFANDKVASDFLTTVMGYTVSSGVYSYNGVVVSAATVLGDLKAAGYSLTDLKNDGTILTFLQTYDSNAGSTFASIASIYPNKASLKDRVGQFGGYTSIAATLNSRQDVFTGKTAVDYSVVGEQYFLPLKNIFGEMNAQELVDALFELDGQGLSLTTMPTMSTGGVWPNAWTRKEQIACKFVLQVYSTTGGEDVFMRFLHAIGMNNDPSGMARIMQQFAYWSVPANYNERNHSDLKFRSAVAAYAGSDLPTDDFYNLFSTGYQQYIHEACGHNHPLVKGMNWETYYKSASGYQPHSLYNKYLDVNGVPAAAKAAYVVPNTDDADTWVALAITADLAPAIAGAAAFGWPVISSTATNKPWGATTLTLGDNEIGSKYIDSADTSEAEAKSNMHLLLSPDGYGISVEEFVQSPTLSTATGPANDEGLLQFTAQPTDDEIGRVLNVLLYISDSTVPSFDMLKKLIGLEKERIGQIFHEAAAAVTAGTAALTAAQRAAIVTEAYSRDNKLGNELFEVLKANPNDGDKLSIGTILVGHLKAANGGNVGATAFTSDTFLAAESAIVDMKSHLTTYPGQIWAAIQDEVADPVNGQENNLEEVFVAAYLRLSEDEKVTFFAESKKWNDGPSREYGDMINATALSSVLMHVYAKQEVNNIGLLAQYEAGVAKLPVAEEAKIRKALD